jgi:hypothetical protein
MRVAGTRRQGFSFGYLHANDGIFSNGDTLRLSPMIIRYQVRRGFSFYSQKANTPVLNSAQDSIHDSPENTTTTCNNTEQHSEPLINFKRN